LRYADPVPKQGPPSDLDTAIVNARKTWPRIAVDPGAVRKHFQKLCERNSRPLAHAADVYLAFAAGQGDPVAIAAIESLLRAQTPGALAHLRQPAAFNQDVQQKLLMRLFLRDKAKIRTYVGNGPLRSWLVAATLRTALNMMERQHQEVSIDEGMPGKNRADDPELEHFRRRYAKPLKAALEDAIRALSPDERNVLRFYFLDGLTVEKIAALRGTHKATVSRLITKTRRALFEQVQRNFGQRFAHGQAEFESVIRLVQSELQVSLERVLSPEPG
jgi:RNA polymerase sigma-70 factor, ECF subfamily